MKNIQLLSCLLLSSVTLHSMEFSTSFSNESDGDAKEIIKNDFKKYLGNRLTEYKKTPFSYDDMQDIKNTYAKMTNKENLSFLSKCLHRDVYDEEGNTFAHIVVKHRDLKMTEWVIDCMKYSLSMPNNAGKEPIDLCIDQLMPNAEEGNKEESCKIFTKLIAGYDKVGFNYNHRRSFLKKIVTLEFEHIKHGTHFAKEDASKYFSGQGAVAQQESVEKLVLSEIYQEVRDEEGNTFTHMLVSHHLSDMLYTFIGKNYITFAKNKDTLNPLALAQKIFLEVAHKLFEQCAPNKDFTISTVSQEDTKKKCCYFMLLNFQRKQDNNTDFKQCCDKHII